jgi:hypothetical protein
MLITANFVAVVAILGGLAGVLLTNLNQRGLIRDQYLRDHRTETYVQVLQELKLREDRVGEAWSLLFESDPSIKAPARPSSADEAQFYGRLLAFASLETADLFDQVERQTSELVDLLNRLRPLPTMGEEHMRGISEIWETRRKRLAAETNLVSMVRAELNFRPSLRQWRLRSQVKTMRKERKAEAVQASREQMERLMDDVFGRYSPPPPEQ